MRRTTLATLLAALLIGSAANALAGPQSTATPQFIDINDFLNKMVAVIDARQSQIETASILNAMPLQQKKNVAGDLRTRCYFDFGDVQRFRTLVAKGLKGVVVDSAYIDAAGTLIKGHKDAQAIYQDQGWFESQVTWYENKYTQYIILRSYRASPGVAIDWDDSKELHESIHSLALGINRRDLDQDGSGRDAPEYISGEFFNHQNTLAKLEEKALTKTLAAVNSLASQAASFTPKTSKATVNAALLPHVIEIHQIATEYLDSVNTSHKRAKYQGDHSWEMVDELMGQWGGKADWEGLVHDAEQNVEVLQGLVSAAAQGNAQKNFNPDFMSFFFGMKCMH